MRSGLVQLGAWTAATGAAVALSWLGVHAVLVDTVFEQPVAVQLPSVASSKPGGPAGPTPSGPPPSSAPPSAAAPSPSPDPSAGATTPAAAGSSAPARPSATARRSSSPPSTLHSYPMLGGRVALDVRATEARLVSAVPEAGWSMQVWHGDQWLQVNFSKDDRVSTLMVSWNGTAPNVQTFVVGN
ncbi:hypothetical protein [Kitasatospora sp. NRRL B-11411]|uniref:hypothetical protein n=1 Tax=Kitasatospora sp. NRRL B-11411 TaxID=1463822 RepID=UPI0004C2CC90|nr:hypothetical protein [Kitasatospora sp. NRRL B-11411]